MKEQDELKKFEERSRKKQRQKDKNLSKKNKPTIKDDEKNKKLHDFIVGLMTGFIINDFIKRL